MGSVVCAKNGTMLEAPLGDRKEVTLRAVLLGEATLRVIPLHFSTFPAEPGLQNVTPYCYRTILLSYSHLNKSLQNSIFTEES